ncbi:MAG TPA: FAD-dependent oxidoreductase [Armatimonadota bacterium]|nr:FAD-dependent oxidoreductase [Armatimonadota bacterium]
MRLLILGGVAAGTKAAARARREYPDADVTIVTKDEYVAYAGCGLPYYVGGEISEAKELIVRTPEEFSQENGITVLTRQEAVRIDPATHDVLVHDLANDMQRQLSYDKLIIATGATPILPNIPGVNLARVTTARGLNDAKVIRESIDTGLARNAVVIGGGFIGLEMAENLAHRGLAVSVVELRSSILPGFDAEIAALVKNHLVEHGVQVFTGEGVTQILGKDGEVAGVETTARTLDADLVVLSVGIRPNSEIAVAAGIATDHRGRILVDEYLQTNLPDIFAIGDCATVRNRITGHDTYSPMGSTANKTGRLVVANLFERQEAFAGVQGTTIVRLFELNAARTGLSTEEARSEGLDVETVLVPTPDRAHYYPGNRMIITKLIADCNSHRLLGAQVVGEGVVDKPIDTLALGIALGMTVEQLSGMDLAYAPPFASALSSSIVAANVMLNKFAGKVRGIAPNELDMNDPDLQLVDVRTEPEHIIAAIPGATNIPLQELDERYEELDPSRPTVVICKVGKRAYSGALLLQRRGFRDVRILDGGMTAWPYETI